MSLRDSRPYREAMAQKKAIRDEKQAARDERFRRYHAANADEPASIFAEAFGVKPPAIRKWCDRLGLKRPGQSDGLYALAHPKRDRRGSR